MEHLINVYFFCSGFKSFFFFANLREKFPIIESRVIRDHLFSTYAKFSKKLTF